MCEFLYSMGSPTVSWLSLTGIWHCYWEYSSLKGKPDSDITISDIGFQTDFRVYLQLSQTWLIFSEISSVFPVYKCLYCNAHALSSWWRLWKVQFDARMTAWYFTAVVSLAVIEVFIILVLIFLRNRVRIAIALLKEGSKLVSFSSYCLMPMHVNG